LLEAKTVSVASTSLLRGVEARQDLAKSAPFRNLAEGGFIKIMGWWRTPRSPEFEGGRPVRGVAEVGASRPPPSIGGPANSDLTLPYAPVWCYRHGDIARQRSALESPAVKRIFFIVLASIVPATLCMAEASLGWPEVIALLAKAKTQATTCVQVLKSNGDKSSIASAQLTYGMAEGEMDGIIAGLTIALVQGGDPNSLATARASLETAGKGLKEICDAAAKTIAPNTKDVLGEMVKAAVEPLIKAISAGVGALWTRHVETDTLERETKKSQLEAAKWPAFVDIHTQ
jgi:hypothetical protein